MDVAGALAELRALARPGALEGMARFGINPRRRIGVSVPDIRALARRIGHDHGLALALWETGIADARILAAMVDRPAAVTEDQMERWVADLDSWDVCDGVCTVLFDRTPWAVARAHEWATREPEFQRRAGFVLMAGLAVHGKQLSDQVFLDFLPVIREYASDDRNFVKKAVNWALRQVGKRGPALNEAAIAAAESIRADGSRSGRWIAADALRELRSEAVQARLRARSSP